jgi:hypothetical protein
VARIVGRADRARIQRQHAEDPVVVAPRQNYGIRLVKKTRRLKFEVTLTADRAGPGRLEAGSDDATARLGKPELATAKSWGKRMTGVMEAALGQLTGSGEIIPGVRVGLELNALEGELELDLSRERPDFEGGPIDIDLLNLAGVIEGRLVREELAKSRKPLARAILASPVGQMLKAGPVKVEGKVEIAMPPQDATRLARMIALTRQQRKNFKWATQAKGKLDEIDADNLKIHQRLKELEGRLGTEGRALMERRARNRAKARELRRRLRTVKKKIGRLERAKGRLARKLRSKAAKIVTRVLGKVSVAVIKKLVPGLNVISAVSDIYTLFQLWASGKAKPIPFGDTDTSASGEGSGEDVADTGPAEPTPQDGSGSGDAEHELGPEVDLSDLPQEPESPQPVQLHPQTFALIEEIADHLGPRLTTEQAEQLQQWLEQQQLDAEELARLIDALRRARVSLADGDDAIGAVIDLAEAIREGQGAETTVSVDGEEVQVEAPTNTPEELESQRAEALAKWIKDLGHRATGERFYFAYRPPKSITTGTVLTGVALMRLRDDTVAAGFVTLVVHVNSASGMIVDHPSIRFYDLSGTLVHTAPARENYEVVADELAPVSRQ